MASTPRVRLLADDLTGACDAGAAFLKVGHLVRVWFGAKAAFPAQESAQAFHTASRGLPAYEAAAAVAGAAASLIGDATTLFFKKIDSAGRGHISAEVLAAHRVLGTHAVLLAPAFPAMGRTVRGGVLEVRDECGQNARVVLRNLFMPEIQDALVVISRPDEVATAIQAGKTVLVCDSATQDDLNALATAAEPLPRLLYAGSAGLAQAIAGLHAMPVPQASFPVAKRTLVIVGTVHPVTNLQLAALTKATSGREDVRILRIGCETADDQRVRAAFAEFDPEALILTGGDTAQLVAEALGAHSMLLQGEFAPGIPWGRLQCGVAEGRIAVTKSGGFGTADTLWKVVAKLSGAA